MELSRFQGGTLLRDRAADWVAIGVYEGSMVGMRYALFCLPSFRTR